MSLVIGPRGFSRSKRTGKVWTFLHSANFDANADSPAAGWSYSADFGFGPILWAGQNGGQALRFGTSGEIGGGQNSLFRSQTILSSTYISGNAITTDLRIDADVKFPSLGGYAKQDGSQGWNSSTACWLTVGNGSRWHTFGIRTTDVFGVWLSASSGDAAAPDSASVPTLTGAIAPLGTWQPVRYEIRLALTGFIRVTYNNSLIINYTGDTRFNAGAPATISAVYICHPAGGTSSNADLNYFGGIDNIAIFR